MDELYQVLFTKIVQDSITLTEHLINASKAKKDSNGEIMSQKLFDDFSALLEKLTNDSNTLTKFDYTKLLVGTLMIINSLQEKILEYQQVINHYEKTLIPGLQKIANSTTEDIESLINDFFRKK